MMTIDPLSETEMPLNQNWSTETYALSTNCNTDQCFFHYADSIVTLTALSLPRHFLQT